LRVPSLRSLIPIRVAGQEAVAASDAVALACRAPFTSLHLDQLGDVRPCCQSSRVLGNVGADTLTEIWQGKSLSELREAMKVDDLSLGCERCEWAGRHGREATYAVRFDRDRLPAPDAGPVRLELAPSNACNLQCTMCNGDWSSSIRLHREKRPALPRLFGDRQLAEVQALADGLDELHLFGGEPLLMPEALRLLDIAAASDTRCTITTNGSVLTPRVEALLGRPGVGLVVSVDGTSPEVYEAIRCGASWSVLQDHLDRFSEIAARHGNTVDLAHCLMTANWREFPDHLTWAAGRGLGVYVNDVLSPVEMSLHHLTPPELAAVVRALRTRQPEIDRLGAPWRATWRKALAGLEQTLADGASGYRHTHLGQLSASTTLAGDGIGAASPLVTLLRQRYRSCQATVELVLDAELLVCSASATGDLERFGLPAPSSFNGKPSAEIQTLLSWTGRPDARTTLHWNLGGASEERRYADDHDGPAERRTIQVDDDRLILRFDYWLPPTDQDEADALRSVALGGELVEITMDADGVTTAIDPTDRAHRFGLRTTIGIVCRDTADAVVPERADPPPAFHADEIAPGLTAVELTWPDGHHLVALVHASAAGTTVRVALPAPLG